MSSLLSCDLFLTVGSWCQLLMLSVRLTCLLHCASRIYPFTCARTMQSLPSHSCTFSDVHVKENVVRVFTVSQTIAHKRLQKVSGSLVYVCRLMRLTQDNLTWSQGLLMVFAFTNIGPICVFMYVHTNAPKIAWQVMLIPAVMRLVDCSRV